MNRKQFDTLSKYDTALYTSRRSNFARMTLREFEEVCVVFTEIFKRDVTNQEKSCGHCKLKIMKQLAEEYFKYKEKLAEKEAAENGNGEE